MMEIGYMLYLRWNINVQRNIRIYGNESSPGLIITFAKLPLSFNNYYNSCVENYPGSSVSIPELTECTTLAEFMFVHVVIICSLVLLNLV